MLPTWPSDRWGQSHDPNDLMHGASDPHNLACMQLSCRMRNSLPFGSNPLGLGWKFGRGHHLTRPTWSNRHRIYYQCISNKTIRNGTKRNDSPSTKMSWHIFLLHWHWPQTLLANHSTPAQASGSAGRQDPTSSTGPGYR